MNFFNKKSTQNISPEKKLMEKENNKSLMIDVVFAIIVLSLFLLLLFISK
jgi:hypothetical protein